MRIIAGRFRGRRLATPSDRTIRPTSDRAREGVFNMLASRTPALDGAIVLDLFCGTAAFACEAISRGAAEVLVIDNEAEALRLARRNLAGLANAAQIAVRQADATKLGRAPKPFSHVFADPPYASEALAPALRALVRGGWLQDDGLVIAEIAAEAPVPAIDGLAVETERRYGAARFVLLRQAVAEPSARA
ncbi:MAG: 16S rRNA (guanine(966)-N(2))-methyltransferase RsmD [Geminicoccaceae bacterium]